MIAELIKEHEDGSATISVELTNEERELLIASGIITAIKEYIEYQKQSQESN